MEIKVTVILQQDGKMNVESNLNPLATARLLGDAQGLILDNLLTEVKAKKEKDEEEVSIEGEIEDKIVN